MSDKFKRILPLLIVAVISAVAILWQPMTKVVPEDLTRSKLERLMEEKAILEAEITPRPFKDIFEIKGM